MQLRKTEIWWKSNSIVYVKTDDIYKDIAEQGLTQIMSWTNNYEKGSIRKLSV